MFTQPETDLFHICSQETNQTFERSHISANRQAGESEGPGAGDTVSGLTLAGSCYLMGNIAVSYRRGGKLLWP